MKNFDVRSSRYWAALFHIRQLRSETVAAALVASITVSNKRNARKGKNKTALNAKYQRNMIGKLLSFLRYRLFHLLHIESEICELCECERLR